MPAHKVITDAIAADILERLADGQPLTKICRETGVKRQTVYDLRARDPEFAAAFDNARLCAAESYIDDAMDYVRSADTKTKAQIARTCSNVLMQAAERFHPTRFGRRQIEVDATGNGAFTVLIGDLKDDLKDDD